MNAPQVDISKGSVVTTVSTQCMSRPADQRFTSLSDLQAQVKLWADGSTATDLHPGKFHAYPDRDTGGLLIAHPDMAVDIAPTNYGFSDVCGLVRAPTRYLSKLSPKLAADCLNEGFGTVDDKLKQVYVGEGAGFAEPTLRCLTSTAYGRITDVDVVDVVRQFAGDGVGDTRWKVPGVMDWSTMVYNPNVDIDKHNTTLYASDRDVFMFLVDDLNPIEVGKTSKGEPDLVFRGFYVWNSEVGSRTFGVATMYLRGVCCNRLLWGVEGFNEVTFRHTSGAPERFLAEAAPALLSYAETGSSKLVAGVAAAKGQIVVSGADEAEKTESRIAFLAKFGFSKAQAAELCLTHVIEEGRPPESVWDFAQAMTAAARDCTFQDQRVKLEQVAGKMLDKVAVPA